MNRLLALLLSSILYVPTHGLCQGMAVNTSGSAAASSAILDVSSTSQGVLVPRMLSSERSSIISPTTGLLVYQTDGTPGFYYYNGTAWTALSGGSSSNDGTIGGGIFYQALASQTTPQLLNQTGTTNRFFMFDMTNNSYWLTHTASVSISLGAANLYAAGTRMQFSIANWPSGSSFPNFNLVSTGATFYTADPAISGITSITLTAGTFTLVTDGVSKWYLF